MRDDIYIGECYAMHAADIQAVEATWRRSRDLADWREILANTQRPVYSIVRNKQIVAYAIYEVIGDTVLIHEIVVDAGFRRQGFGRRLLNFATAHVSHGGRLAAIDLRVREENLDGQLFLRACGIDCVVIEEGPDGQPLYLFRKTRECVGVGASR